jgi:hypothetical protein
VLHSSFRDEFVVDGAENNLQDHLWIPRELDALIRAAEDNGSEHDEDSYHCHHSLLEVRLHWRIKEERPGARGLRWGQSTILRKSKSKTVWTIWHCSADGRLYPERKERKSTPVMRDHHSEIGWSLPLVQ